MALTQNRNLVEKIGTFQAFAKGSQLLYKNCLLMIDTDGLVKKATPKAGTHFAGISYAGAEAEDKLVQSEIQGIWYLTGTGFTQADVGKKAYALDDENVTVTEGADKKQIVGVIVEFVSATSVGVKLMPFSGTGA